VRVGDVEVAAGDWVVADVDGVTFVPAETVEEVLDAGRAREAKEDGFFTALRDGATTVELLGLDAALIRGPEA
jgi:4-hydroxy-4-methyl-2-oxoglutarate aldolase